ncbi:hypothetical protein BCR59_28000 [Klebsiella pneumoniae]|nr:hypothetical protein BCR59_28000 [Klebsiella pneumoniae]
MNSACASSRDAERQLGPSFCKTPGVKRLRYRRLGKRASGAGKARIASLADSVSNASRRRGLRSRLNELEQRLREQQGR